MGCCASKPETRLEALAAHDKDGDPSNSWHTNTARAHSTPLTAGRLRKVQLYQELKSLGVVLYSAQQLDAALFASGTAQLVGKGGYGAVYRAQLDGVDVAVKIFRKNHCAHHFFLHELNVLSKLKHPFLAALVGFCPQPEALVFKYYEKGTLRDWLARKRGTLDWQARLRIAHELALALEYAHSPDDLAVVHMDVKPSNVLLDRPMMSNLTDFGLAQLLDVEEVGLGSESSFASGDSSDSELGARLRHQSEVLQFVPSGDAGAQGPAAGVKRPSLRSTWPADVVVSIPGPEGAGGSPPPSVMDSDEWPALGKGQSLGAAGVGSGDVAPAARRDQQLSTSTLGPAPGHTSSHSHHPHRPHHGHSSVTSKHASGASRHSPAAAAADGAGPLQLGRGSGGAVGQGSQPASSWGGGSSIRGSSFDSQASYTSRVRGGSEDEFVVVEEVVRPGRPLGTRGYIDPCLETLGTITPAVDVFSFGIMMCQLLTACKAQVLMSAQPGAPLVSVSLMVKSALDGGQLRGALDRHAGSWPPGIAEAFARLALTCCEPSREARPGMDEVAERLCQLRVAVGDASLPATMGALRTAPALRSGQQADWVEAAMAGLPMVVE